MEEIATGFKTTTITNSRLSEIDFDNIAFGREFSDHMFIADFKNGQWSEGEIMPYQPISFGPSMSALHYGQAIFEGMKAFRSEENGEDILLFRPCENARRFNKSAVRMCMPEVPEELFINALKELVDLDRAWVPKNEGGSLYMRPFMFATDEFIGMKPSESYRFCIFTCPVGAYYAEPVRVKLERQYIRSAAGGTGAAKCAGNYAGSMYPARLAQEKGYHQLMWTDAKEHKYIEESGTMNLMFIINNRIITAPTSDTILPGITRKSILQLAREWGYQVEERYLAVDELVEALKIGTLQEAFGVGTAATIAHIALIHAEGTDFNLPAIEQREFSNRAKKELRNIQRGIVADKYGWIESI